MYLHTFFFLSSSAYFSASITIFSISSLLKPPLLCITTETIKQNVPSTTCTLLESSSSFTHQTITHAEEGHFLNKLYYLYLIHISLNLL